MRNVQPSMFDLIADVRRPDGFGYRPDFISADEERRLVEAIRQVPFSSVEMRGQTAKRRTAHFGWTYGYRSRETAPGPPVPAFPLDIRARAAEWAGLEPDDFAEALLTEYDAGAGIGWHRDAPMFGDVVAGISLLGACRMRFRPYVSPAMAYPGRRTTTHVADLLPRSGYLMTGAARRDYEHSIPGTATLRYSITFRTVRAAAKGPRVQRGG